MPFNRFKFTSLEHNLHCSCKGMYCAIFTTVAWLNLIKKQYSLERARIPSYEPVQNWNIYPKAQGRCFLGLAAELFIVEVCAAGRYFSCVCTVCMVDRRCPTGGRSAKIGKPSVSVPHCSNSTPSHLQRHSLCQRHTDKHAKSCCAFMEILTVVVKWQYMFCFVMVFVPFWFLPVLL